MFSNEILKKYLETSSTIKSKSLIVAEWNMNVLDNILIAGNYRYRPEERYIENTSGYADYQKYSILPTTFDINDLGNFYTGATDADVKIDAGLDDNNEPTFFQSQKTKEKLLYSLEDCFGKFRPRSGINKIRFFDTANSRFLQYDNQNMALRPRYYVSSDTDVFKYWTSYRTENGLEFGISKNRYIYKDINGDQIFPYGNGSDGPHYISDAAPFVVYKDPVPANRLVVKLQTHVGSYKIDDFQSSDLATVLEDPAYGAKNARVPLRWKIQYLQDNQWRTAKEFDETSLRSDGSQIIGPDGYVEIFYGLKVPKIYKQIFVHAGTLSSPIALPEISVNGYSYLVKTSNTDLGTYYVWIDGDYQTFVPEYSWSLLEESSGSDSLILDLTSPDYFIDTTNANNKKYREFEYLSGIRIVVDSVNRSETTLDLIEMSPRLCVDLTQKTQNVQVTKVASDLGEAGLPVGQLLASTGSVTIFDYDQSFLETNENSLIAKFLTNNFQVSISEVIEDSNGDTYTVPIKTMYSETFPSINSSTRTVSILLRDRFLQFESQTAPQMLLRDVSLSYAISTLLDSIGFSNYTFKRNAGESELTIPFFFIAPNTTVAEVLNQLAASAQAAMFFDEYNNFVVMSKGYLMPSQNERATDITLYGSNDFEKDGLIKNKTTTSKLANIVDIASRENQIFNDGKITYSSRAIQRTYSGMDNADRLDVDKKWVYKPVLLWEVSPTEALRNTSGETQTQSGYALSAIPLNTTLSSDVPAVVNNELINNTMDLGEAIYSLARYAGYLYANGEIIRYDAMQYNVIGKEVADQNGTNNVWISSAAEYYSYFQKLPFGGKMYPTGLIRIFSEPQYEVYSGQTRLKNSTSIKHGRGQFNTPIVNHSAGVDNYWTKDENVFGRLTQSGFLFENPKVIVLSNVYMSTTTNTLTVPDASKIQVGYYVSMVSSSNLGALSTDGDTKITAVSGNTITFNRAPSKNLIGATLHVYFKMDNNGVTDEPNRYRQDEIARKSSRSGIIKNFLTSESIEESDINKLSKTKAGTVQSSALVVTGPPPEEDRYSSRDFLTIIHKPLSNSSSPSSFRHFGTRLRLVGRPSTGAVAGSQQPIGSSPFLTATKTEVTALGPTTAQINVSASSGGLAVLFNSKTGIGYYFEILALTDTKLSGYQANGNLHNVFFYKLVNQANKPNTGNSAMPVKLWSDFTSILVDDGTMVGQSRIVGEQSPTVYDLSVEYEDIGGIRRFYLYINDKRVAVVDDTFPLPVYNNMALFVRGSSRVMFENIFAIGNNYNKNYNYSIDNPISATFSADKVSSSNSFRKYAMSGVVQSSYLSGITPGDVPQYNMYFEEFGTIMREVAYFKIRYDKAYPALYSQIVPTFNSLKGYVVSGYTPDAYGAEFLVFNSTDTTLVLDDESQNYLKISGIAFTAQTDNEISVDSYFSERANSSDPVYQNGQIVSPNLADAEFTTIKQSRAMYGRKEFNIQTPFIQTEDSAKDLLGWIIGKVMKPKISVGVRIFSNPMIQLGDIIDIDYKSRDNVNQISYSGSRFVVYNIDYSRGIDGPSMTVYLSEVV